MGSFVRCNGIPASGLLDFGRPRVWEPMFSTQQSLVNVSIRNQAFWAVHPYGCNDVYIANVNVTAPRDEGIANDDGKWLPRRTKPVSRAPGIRLSHV